MRKALILLAVIFSACAQRPQYRPEVNNFLEQHSEIRVFYLYESTLRMLNNFFEGATDSAFSQVHQARLGLIMGDDANNLQSDLQKLYTQLESNGAEVLFALRRNGTTSAAYQTNPKGDGYLLCLSDAHSTILIEISGHMSLQDIQNLSTMDFEKISTVFDLKQPEKNGKEEADHEHTQQSDSSST